MRLMVWVVRPLKVVCLWVWQRVGAVGGVGPSQQVVQQGVDLVELDAGWVRDVVLDLLKESCEGAGQRAHVLDGGGRVALGGAAPARGRWGVLPGGLLCVGGVDRGGVEHGGEVRGVDLLLGCRWIWPWSLRGVRCRVSSSSAQWGRLSVKTSKRRRRVYHHVAGVLKVGCVGSAC